MNLRQQSVTGAVTNSFLPHGRAVKEQKRNEKNKNSVINVGREDENNDARDSQYSSTQMDIDEMASDKDEDEFVDIQEELKEQIQSTDSNSISKKTTGATAQKMDESSNGEINVNGNRTNETYIGATDENTQTAGAGSLEVNTGMSEDTVEGTVRLRFSILFDGGVGTPLGSAVGADGAPPPNPTLNAENAQSDQELLMRTSVLDAVAWALCEDNSEAILVATGGPCGDGWQAADVVSVSIIAPYAGAGMSLSLQNGWADLLPGSSNYDERFSGEYIEGLSLRWTEWEIVVPVVHIAERLGDNTTESVTGGQQGSSTVTATSAVGADAQSAALWNVERSANLLLQSQIEAGTFDSILRASDGRIWASSPRHAEVGFFGRFLLSPAAEQMGLVDEHAAEPSEKQIFGVHPTLFAVAVLMLVLGFLVTYLVVSPRRKPKILLS